MAAINAVRSKHATLTANTVDVVTLDRAYNTLEVINRDAAADLWVTVDSGPTGARTTQTPTVAGDGCYHIGPGKTRLITADSTWGSVKPPASVVRLISSAAVAYSVTGIA